MSDKPLTKILVIDDDQDILIMTQFALKRIQNVIVKSLSSGELALKESLEFRPDLILLDIMMPGLDGLSILKILREHQETHSIPIVFFTAKAMQNELDKYKSAGAVDIIIKPFDPLSLPELLLEIWKRV